MRTIVILLIICFLNTLYSIEPKISKNTDKNSDNIAAKNKQKLDLIKRIHLKRKDPFIAGLLSWPMWGLGQFYAKEYTKGSLFVFGDLIYKSLLIGMVIKFNNKYTSKSSGDSRVNWKEMSTADKSFIIGYIITYIGFSFWSMIDAVNSAKNYNNKFKLHEHFNMSLNNENKTTSLKLGWHFKF